MGIYLLLKLQIMKRKLPPSVNLALRKVGQDIEVGRKRRRWTEDSMAERIGVTRKTYAKIEKGDPTVSWGAVAMALFALQMTDRLRGLADSQADEVGLFAEVEQLPKRVRLPMSKGGKKGDAQ